MARRYHLPAQGATPLCSRQLSRIAPRVQGQSTMRVLGADGQFAGKPVAPSAICRHCQREALLLPPVGAEEPSGESISEAEGEDFARDLGEED